MTSPLDRAGTIGLATLVVLCTAIWIAQPWSPPPPSSTALAVGVLALWLLPPRGRWVERHRFVQGVAREP